MLYKVRHPSGTMLCKSVIPAKAGIHFDFDGRNMDSSPLSWGLKAAGMTQDSRDR
jgi:hypothetical protein